MATSSIGRDTPRVDGPLKVSGKAQYASDFHFPGMLYAMPVAATIANGRVTALDSTTAVRMPGVRGVHSPPGMRTPGVRASSHRENIGKICRSTLGPGSRGVTEEPRPPFED